MHHSPTLPLRSLMALAMVSAAGATIAQTPKLAEGIATGIKRVLDVLAPEHEAQGQPSVASGLMNLNIDLEKFAESVAANRLARSGVTGCFGPIPTVVVGPGGSIAGVAASIPPHKDEPAMPAGPCDCSVEAEILAKGLSAPRVTPADIQAEIVGEHYFTAEQGARHADAKNLLDCGNIPKNLGLLTFCVLRLRNGFTVTGESACASAGNFDAVIGRRIARENAVQKIWPLLGFRLRDQLARTKPANLG